MHQPPSNNLLQCQIKKNTGRSKPADISAHCGNVKKQKNVPNSGNSKVSLRKPLKGYNKQLNSGQRERTFSKNERRIGGAESRNDYMEQNFHFSDGFAAHNLLNFHYSSGRNVESTNSRRYQVSRQRKACFNKEAYLQAKCQFVVTGCADNYLMNAQDPDKLVDWENIQLVYLPSHETPNCPICLYTPVAAKITRCGHIFCWSCVLHYLHLGDKAWRKCPICHEAVHKNDLKSVKSYAQTKYARLDTIPMKLMRRPKDSVFVSLANESDKVNAEFSSWMDNETPSFNFGSKLMLASPEEIVHHILMKQRNELQTQLNNDLSEENGEDVFIKMALEILEEEIKSFKLKDACEQPTETVENEEDSTQVLENESTLSDMLNNFSVSRSFVEETAFSDDEFALDTTTEIEGAQNVSEAPIGDQACSAGDSSFSSECNVSDNRKDARSPCAESPSKHSSNSGLKTPSYADSYFFYQVEDSQNIFLHSINARCLIEEYGSLNYGPNKINGQIVDFECYTMTKELRKRFRYLGHLPLSCEFMMCELILKPPVLSKHTIHNFMPEFKNRKANRLKKFKEQQKFDRLATAAGNKQHGFRYISEEYDDEDDIGIDLSNTVDFPSNLSPDTAESESKESDKGMPPTQQFQGISFAQMLNKKTEITSPPKEVVNTVDRRFRGYEILRSSREHPPTHDQLHEPHNQDDYGPDVVAPDFKDTFSAAMFAAPIKTEERPTEGSNKKRNKKRDKGMLLFGTGGQRKY